MEADRFLTADKIKQGSIWRSSAGNTITVKEVKNGTVSYTSKDGTKWSIDYFSFQCKHVPLSEEQ